MTINLKKRLKTVSSKKLSLLLSIVSTLVGCASGLSPSLQEEAVSVADENITKNSRARFLFVRAELALKQDNFKDAIEYFEQANALVSEKSPTIYKRLAQLYIREGRLQDALVAAEQMEASGGPQKECYKLRAGILNALGRKIEAIEVYKKLVSISTKEDEESFLLLSGSYIQDSKFNDAVLILEDLYKKNPESFVANYYLAKLYASLKDFDKSIMHYKRAIDINPTAEQVSLEYVKVLVLSQKMDLAISTCAQLVKDNPDSVKAKELLSELRAGEKKIENAIQEFEEAKKSGKSSIDLQFKVALFKLQQRDFKGAESELSLILSQDPNNDEARYYLATAYASQENISLAVEQLKKISTKNDLYKKARGFASFLLRQENKSEQALALIQEALVSFPNDVELLGYKTSIEREQKNMPAAIETLRKIASLEPENEQHLFNLAVALDESKERKEALEVMEQVLKKNPQHANALNYVGYTLAEEGKDLDRAEKLVTQALEIEKDNGFFLDSLGWVLYKKGQYEKALPILERSVSLTQGDAVIVEHLARVYLALKNNEKALQYFEQALDRLKRTNADSDAALRAEIEEIIQSLKR